MNARASFSSRRATSTSSFLEGIRRFAKILEEEGIPTTIRWSRGVDVGAACGQLALKEAGPLTFHAMR